MGTWYDSRGRLWHEGNQDLLESGTVFVSRSNEDGAGEGLFLQRRVYQTSKPMLQIKNLLKVFGGSLVAYYSGQPRLMREVSMRR